MRIVGILCLLAAGSLLTPGAQASIAPPSTAVSKADIILRFPLTCAKMRNTLAGTAFELTCQGGKKEARSGKPFSSRAFTARFKGRNYQQFAREVARLKRQSVILGVIAES